MVCHDRLLIGPPLFDDRRSSRSNTTSCAACAMDACRRGHRTFEPDLARSGHGDGYPGIASPPIVDPEAIVQLPFPRLSSKKDIGSPLRASPDQRRRRPPGEPSAPLTPPGRRPCRKSTITWECDQNRAVSGAQPRGRWDSRGPRRPPQGGAVALMFPMRRGGRCRACVARHHPC